MTNALLAIIPQMNDFTLDVPLPAVGGLISVYGRRVTFTRLRVSSATISTDLGG